MGKRASAVVTGLEVVVVASLAIAPLVALPACSSDAGVTVDAPSGDGGGGATDGGAAGDDAATERDGGAPGPLPDGAPAGPFCASLAPQPSFCEDFDDGTLPTVGDTQVDDGGSVALTTDVSRSPSSSLRVRSAPAQGAFTDALLRVPIDAPASPTRFVVGFAYRPEAATPQGTFVIARAFLSLTHQITLELASADGPVLREIDTGGVYESVALTRLPTAGAWTRWELEMDLAARKVVVRADGVEAAKGALAGTTYDLYAANLGVTTDAPASATVHYDDVVLDLE